MRGAFLEKNINWDAFHKIDQVTILEVLSSIAGAMLSTRAIPETQIQQFQSEIRSLHTSSYGAEVSVLQELASTHSPFLNVVLNRFEISGFFKILTRVSLGVLLDHTRANLLDSGKKFAEKSQLFFNRKIPFTNNKGDIVRYGLFSGLVVNFAEYLFDEIEKLNKLMSYNLSSMMPSLFSMYDNNEAAIDIELAKQLGFEQVATESMENLRESSFLLRFSSIILELSNLCDNLITELDHAGIPYPKKVLLSIEWLRGEGERITRFKPISSTMCNLDAEELRRQNICSTIFAINITLETVLEELLSALKGVPVSFKPEPYSITSSETGYWTQHLIARGYTMKLASDISESIKSYCSAQKVSPSRLLDSELNRIHPECPKDLTSLFQVSSLCHNDLTNPSQTNEKTDLLKRVSTLMSKFQRNSQLLCLFIIALPTLGGCGVKTSPRSELEEIRPPIPFRQSIEVDSIKKSPQESLQLNRKKSN